MSEATSTNGPGPSASRVRYSVVGVTTLMAVLLYLDRFCISFAATFIREDLDLSAQQISWLLSSFFLPYALFQVPSGWMTDRYGPRLMLTIYILAWSLFTGLMGVVSSFVLLMALRLGFGVAQAGAYPTGGNIVSKWAPLQARGMASGIVSMGGRVGGVLAMYATGILIVFLTSSAIPEIGGDEVMNATRLCYDLGLQEDEKKQALSEKVLVAFSDEGKQVVTRHADRYAVALTEERAKLEAKGEKPESASPKVDEVPQADVDTLATELTKIVQSESFFKLDDIPAELSTEKEVKRLLVKDNVTEKESRRINRLVLESVFPDNIKKLYIAGWRPMMWTYGGLGVLVALMVWLGCRDRPSDHPRCNIAEQKLIAGDSGPVNESTKVGKPPVKEMATSWNIWLVCLMQWFTNVGWIFLLTYAPAYFEKVHQTPTEMRAIMVAIPPFIGWIGMLSGGWLTDFLVKRLGLRLGRSLPISLSRFLAMAAYLVCLTTPSPWLAVAMFSVVAFATDVGNPAMWAFNQDVGGRHVGSVLGWGNMWGNFGAFVTPPILVAIIGENQNWNAAFLTCAGAFLLSGLCALGIDASKRLKTEEKPAD